uniref:Uncharacterized protein n=1 Tax=Ascaris lumbricoides TaxID=6252 RepID=A0A9J2P603_ASCLU
MLGGPEELIPVFCAIQLAQNISFDECASFGFGWVPSIKCEQVIRTVAFRLTAVYLQVNSTAVTTSEVSEVHRLSPRLWSPNLPLVVLPNCLKALNITAGECALYANIYDNDDGKVRRSEMEFCSPSATPGFFAQLTANK